jgi:hypothetical protein
MLERNNAQEILDPHTVWFIGVHVSSIGLFEVSSFLRDILWISNVFVLNGGASSLGQRLPYSLP